MPIIVQFLDRNEKKTKKKPKKYSIQVTEYRGHLGKFI
jgi:hypothetical protein